MEICNDVINTEHIIVNIFRHLLLSLNSHIFSGAVACDSVNNLFFPHDEKYIHKIHWPEKCEIKARDIIWKSC